MKQRIIGSNIFKVLIGLLLVTGFTCSTKTEAQSTKPSMKLGVYPFTGWSDKNISDSGSKLYVSPEGLSITGGDDNPPMATCPVPGYSASGKWLVIRMSADAGSGPYGGFWFTRSPGYAIRGNW